MRFFFYYIFKKNLIMPFYLNLSPPHYGAQIYAFHEVNVFLNRMTSFRVVTGILVAHLT